MPGDPVAILAGNGELTQEQVDAIRALWGLDKPILEQFVVYMTNVFRGDFGLSFATRRPVINEIAYWFPNTLLLMIPALVLSVLIGIFLGVFAASRLGKKSDYFTLTAALAARSVPVFLTGMILLAIFATEFRLFPLAGTFSRPPPTNPLAFALDVLWHMILPVSSLVLMYTGTFVLLVRNCMMDEITQDYMMPAEAKGLPKRRVLYRYAFRNATLPVSTSIAMSIGYCISGSILVETVFSWQGLGRFIYDSTLKMDFPALQAIFFILAVTVVLANFLVDIVYMFLDPRVRY